MYVTAVVLSWRKITRVLIPILLARNLTLNSDADPKGKNVPGSFRVLYLISEALQCNTNNHN